MQDIFRSPNRLHLHLIPAPRFHRGFIPLVHKPNEIKARHKNIRCIHNGFINNFLPIRYATSRLPLTHGFHLRIINGS